MRLFVHDGSFIRLMWCQAVLLPVSLTESLLSEGFHLLKKKKKKKTLL